jgi:hypothetical protein
MNVPVPLLSALAGAAVLSGCSGPPVDASCDVPGVTAEVAHMVGESSLTLESIASLQCSGDWVVARASVSGDTAGSGQSTFILLRSEVGWVLKAPEVVCGTAVEARTIPDDLFDAACPEDDTP